VLHLRRRPGQNALASALASAALAAALAAAAARAAALAAASLAAATLALAAALAAAALAAALAAAALAAAQSAAPAALAALAAAPAALADANASAAAAVRVFVLLLEVLRHGRSRYQDRLHVLGHLLLLQGHVRTLHVDRPVCTSARRIQVRRCWVQRGQCLPRGPATALATPAGPPALARAVAAAAVETALKPAHAAAALAAAALAAAIATAIATATLAAAIASRGGRPRPDQIPPTTLASWGGDGATTRGAGPREGPLKVCRRGGAQQVGRGSSRLPGASTSCVFRCVL